ncbi:CoA transferase [Rhodococcus globerulus]|uniref:CaiB/BaiF CoA transferase family protein n=1 Tax=Rhodococcus globerulus TaxID=33008 RepID=UPI003018C9BC
MLDGIRVLDVATLAAAPLAATYLGEFGADVIKVEQPQGGDPIRKWGAQKDGVGLMWKSIGRNKKAITLDLRTEEGRELMRGLAAKSDVVVVNTRPHTLRKWELDYERLSADNPGLIMLHITGYGLGGPKSDQPGFGTLGEAMSGFAHVTGQPDGPPTLPPFMLADGVASLNAAYAVMMALYHRDVHGGGGQLIDINLIDPLSRLLEQSVLMYDQLGIIQQRNGNRWDISAPRNTYETKDGRWLAMSGSAPTVALRAFRAIGRADLADDPDFSDPQRRLERAAETDKVVADWVITQTLEDALAVFDRESVAAAPVYDSSQLIDDEHLRDRGVYVNVPDSELDDMRVQAPVPRFSGVEGKVSHLGPKLGEHTNEVLTDVLGLGRGAIDDLRARGII